MMKSWTPDRNTAANTRRATTLSCRKDGIRNETLNVSEDLLARIAKLRQR